MGAPNPRVLGRYALYDEIAAGGMATVHYGRLLGPVGFSRTVAIKRLHAQLAKDPEFVAMFLDEARLAARIHHPNVVQTLDVVSTDNELFLVMEYVEGESLARLVRGAAAEEQPIPLEIISTIISGSLLGLHAAHGACDEHAQPLGIVHRDVSPQNILVGADGVPRVLDFGVAKAAGRVQTTREGQLKGKIAYMAQEQLNLTHVDRRADVYAIGVVLWEALTLKRLYAGENEAGIMAKVLKGVPPPPSSVTPVPEAVEKIVMRALEYEQDKRFQTAREMQEALEEAVPMASAPRVAQWVEKLAGGQLAARKGSIARIESHSGTGPVPDISLLADTERTRTNPDAVMGTRSHADLSTISASSAALQGQPASRARRSPLLVTVGIIAGAGAALYLSLGSSRHEAVVGSAAPVASAVAPTPSAEVAVVALASAPPEPPASSAPSPAVTAAPRAASKAPARPQTAHAASASSPASEKAAPECTITSYLDESGIKHFTKECK